MKHFRMLAAGRCSAVLLCVFAIPAYAYSDGGNEEPPVLEETPAPEPAPTITPGEGFSEDGNLSLIHICHQSLRLECGQAGSPGAL